MPSRKLVISILGPSHTASTALGAMLGSSTHKLEFHIGEAHAYFTKSHPKYGWRNCVTEKACPIWGRIPADTPQKNVFETIFSAYPCDVIIDSSKNINWTLNTTKHLNEANIDHALILMWRDPRKIAQSCYARKQSTERIQSEMSYYEQAVVRFDNIRLVHVKELIESPSNSLAKICRNVGISYFPGKEKYWEFEHHHKHGAGLTSRHIRLPLTATIDKDRSQRKAIELPRELSDFVQNKSQLIYQLLQEQGLFGKSLNL